jgi:integrase
MASVVKDAKGRSPFWYACYRDADGRRLKKSTELTAKSKALEMARGLEKAALEKKKGALTEARARVLLGEILQGITGQALRVYSVREWLAEFVKQKKKARAEKTAARHEQMMDEFVEFIGDRADKNIAGITSSDIAAFRDKRQSRGLTPATVNLDVKVLSAAFNRALKQGHIPVNPCAGVEPLKDDGPHRPKDTFTPEQVSALMAAAKGDWKGLVLVAFYTGQRLGDCATLRWRNVDLVKKTIRFQTGKTGQQIEVPMHEALEDYLLGLPTAKSDDDFLFPPLGEQAQRNVSPLSKQFRKLMKQAKIEQRVIRQREGEKTAARTVYGLSFHSLRHSFSSILANAGVPEEVRMALTGHRSRDVHKRYTHHELERLRAAAALLPRIK